jgi:hypothetical protein
MPKDRHPKRGVVAGQAPDTPAAAASAPTDWEAIEREYRAGVLSVREIAKRHGITHGAINKRAKRDGWKRDLTAKVREAVSTALVSTPVSTREAKDRADTEKRTEREIVEDAAALVVSLVREHRADLTGLRELAASLTEQLRMAAGNRDALIALIEEAVEEMPDANVGQRAKRDAAFKAMHAAVSLPAHVSTLKDLSMVLKNLIPLERQAFNVDAGGPEDAPEDENTLPPSMAALAAFEAKLDARLRDAPQPTPPQ